MSDEIGATADPDPSLDDSPQPENDPPPDESTLLGASGVEAEVLAETARAEAELADPTHDDSADSEGAEV